LNPSAFFLPHTLLFFCFFLANGFIFNPLYAQIPNPQKPDTAYRMGLLARYFTLQGKNGRSYPGHKKQIMPDFRIWPRLDSLAGDTGFNPGDSFGLELSGEWIFPDSDSCLLTFESHGNARLWLDGRLIFSLQGPKKKGQVRLLPGYGPHRVKVRHKPSGSGKKPVLILRWDKGPGGITEVVPEEFFRVRRKEVRNARLKKKK
jgi:hypothetical protein